MTIQLYTHCTIKEGTCFGSYVVYDYSMLDHDIMDLGNETINTGEYCTIIIGLTNIYEKGGLIEGDSIEIISSNKLVVNQITDKKKCNEELYRLKTSLKLLTSMYPIKTKYKYQEKSTIFNKMVN